MRKSGAGDARALTTLLVESFRDDPVIQWFLRQDARHDDAEREFFHLAVVRQALPFGEVMQVGDHACALWVPPGAWRLGLRDQLLLAPAIFRIAGLRRVPTVLRALQNMEALHPAAPHIYLSFLCAHPQQRGRGHGTALMVAMTERCDREGLPIYLENTKPHNEAFYRRHGFRVLHDIPLPGSDIPYRGMWRDPV